jgi:hypothetical protein
LLVAFCLALCTAAAFAGTAGQVMFAYGETHALRSGRIVQLQAGSEVDSGDQLHTGVDSYLQIRFTDWGVMSLRPHTDFVIDRYVYEAHAGGMERAFFSLLNGGVRSLTGLIGRRNHDHYRMRTNMTSIGIRGTNYAVLICNRDCKLDDGSLGEDGVYGGVTEGRIAVSPYGRTGLEREFGAGEYFRVLSPNTAPERFSEPPPFFWDKNEPQARAAGRTFAGITWKASPGAPSEVSGPVADEVGGVAGSLLRTDGSLTLSPITAPVLNLVGAPVSKTTGSLVTSASALAAPVVNGVVQPVTGIVVSTLPVAGALVSPLATEVVLPAAGLAGSIVNSALTMPGVVPLVGPVVNAVPVVVAPVVTAVGGVVNTVLPVVPPVTVPVVPPVTTLPVTTPTLPPVTTPTVPVTTPTIPVTTPTIPVTTPTVPVTTPTVPVTTPTLPPVTTPTVPVTTPTLPVTTPALPPVTLPTVPSLPLSKSFIAPLRR